MATKVPTLSQEPASLNLAWRVGDAVTLQFLVKNADWTGTYEADVRTRATVEPPLATMSVTTVMVGLDTLFTLILSAADSRTVGRGKFVWDLEDMGSNLTRLTGEVNVSQDVTRV